MRRWYLGGLAVLCAFIAWVRVGRGAEQRVGVAAHDTSLRDAIEAVLAPWGVSAVTVDRSPTTTSASEAAQQARTIAEEHGLAALVWTAGTSVWIFEASTGQLAVRPLPSSTLDDATAAAAALSVKATLRDALATPVEQAPAPVTEAVPAAASPSATPAPESAVSSAGSPPASRGPRPPPLRLRMLLIGGVRARTGVDAPEAWAGAGASLWPHAWNERLGFELSGRAGFGVGVSRPDFAGRYAHDSAAAYALGRFPLAEWATLEVGPGFSLEVLALQGTVFGAPQRVDVERVDPALLARGALDVRIGSRLQLGASLDAAYLLRYQQFLVDADRVLQQPALTLDVGVRLSVEVN